MKLGSRLARLAIATQLVAIVGCGGNQDAAAALARLNRCMQREAILCLVDHRGVEFAALFDGTPRTTVVALALLGGPPEPRLAELLRDWPRWRPSSLPDDVGILFVEQPSIEWSESCTALNTSYWRTVRAGVPDVALANRVATDCVTEEFGPGLAAWVSAINLAVASIPQRVEGVVASSFGAAESDLLLSRSMLRPKWRIAASPTFGGRSGDALLNERAKAGARRIAALGLPTDFLVRLDTDRQVQGRAVTLIRSDVAFALARGMDEPAEVIHALVQGDMPANVLVGQLSDAFSQRYGSDDYGSRSLTYWTWFCTSFGWTSDPDRISRIPDGMSIEFTLHWVLDAVHAPCGGMNTDHDRVRSHSAVPTLDLVPSHDGLASAGRPADVIVEIDTYDHSVLAYRSGCLGRAVKQFLDDLEGTNQQC